MNIFNFAQYPTPNDWDQICSNKQEIMNKIQFDIDKKTYNFLDFSQIKEMEYTYWLREFNNRACSKSLKFDKKNKNAP